MCLVVLEEELVGVDKIGLLVFLDESTNDAHLAVL